MIDKVNESSSDGAEELIAFYNTPVEKYIHEMIEVFDMHEKFQGIWSRKAYYAKLFRECSLNPDYKPAYQIKGVRLQVVNPEGKFYLQRRSKSKQVNGGLIDKTLGGHVPAGIDYDDALLEELKEELGKKNKDVVLLDFSELTKEKLNQYDLEKKVVCARENRIFGWWNERIVYNSDAGRRIKFHQPWINTFYWGFYDGDISSFPDGEADKVLLMHPDDILKEMKSDLNYEVFCPEVKHFAQLFNKGGYRWLIDDN